MKLLSDIPEEVSTKFEKLALEISAVGHKRYSADAILHVIRWHHDIQHAEGSFKANDHWTAALSRWFLARHPEMKGFFCLRKSQLDAVA